MSKINQVAKSVLNKITGAFTDTYRKVTDQSNLVTHVCDIIAEDYSEAVPATHIKEIVENIGDEMGWTGRTRDSRLSECRAVLRSHHKLDGLCAAIIEDKRCEKFQWHDAIKVGRIWVRLNKKGTPTVKKVKAEYFKKNKAPQVDPLEKIATDILNSVSKSAFVQALQKVCEEHGYELSS